MAQVKFGDNFTARRPEVAGSRKGMLGSESFSYMFVIILRVKLYPFMSSYGVQLLEKYQKELHDNFCTEHTKITYSHLGHVVSYGPDHYQDEKAAQGDVTDEALGVPRDVFERLKHRHREKPF